MAGRRAVTLLELVVVMVIMGVRRAILVPMWDYNGDSAHGLVEPPLHGGKVQNSLYRDGSVSH